MYTNKKASAKATNSAKSASSVITEIYRGDVWLFYFYHYGTLLFYYGNKSVTAYTHRLYDAIKTAAGVLLGIKLDNKMLFEREVNIISCGKRSNLCDNLSFVKLYPFRSNARIKSFYEILEFF